MGASKSKKLSSSKTEKPKAKKTRKRKRKEKKALETQVVEHSSPAPPDTALGGAVAPDNVATVDVPQQSTGVITVSSTTTATSEAAPPVDTLDRQIYVMLTPLESECQENEGGSQAPIEPDIAQGSGSQENQVTESNHDSSEPAVTLSPQNSTSCSLGDPNGLVDQPCHSISDICSETKANPPNLNNSEKGSIRHLSRTPHSEKCASPASSLSPSGLDSEQEIPELDPQRTPSPSQKLKLAKTNSFNLSQRREVPLRLVRCFSTTELTNRTKMLVALGNTKSTGHRYYSLLSLHSDFSDYISINIRRDDFGGSQDTINLYTTSESKKDAKRDTYVSINGELAAFYFENIPPDIELPKPAPRPYEEIYTFSDRDPLPVTFLEEHGYLTDVEGEPVSSLAQNHWQSEHSGIFSTLTSQLMDTPTGPPTLMMKNPSYIPIEELEQKEIQNQIKGDPYRYINLEYIHWYISCEANRNSDSSSASWNGTNITDDRYMSFDEADDTLVNNSNFC